MAAHQRAPLNAAPARTKGAHSCTSIAVTSGKGGVGKTTISLALALGLAACNKKVLLIDADLGLANIHIALGLAPRFNISHCLDGQCTLEEVIIPGPGNIAILPGASGLEALANIDSLRLGQFMRSLAAVEQQYDVLVVDTAAGIGAATIQFVCSAELALVVVTPEPTSMADAYAMIKVLGQKGAPAPRVVVNMARSQAEASQIFDRLNSLVVKFIQRPLVCAALLPLDAAVPRAVRQQQALMETSRGSDFARRMLELARNICGTQAVAPSRGGFFARLFKHS
jgi:flagellar biosynthesis protein FlhG